jgi:hypothetical protein
MQSQVQVMCRRGVGLNPLKDVQGRESISLYHGLFQYVMEKKNHNQMHGQKIENFTNLWVSAMSRVSNKYSNFVFIAPEADDMAGHRLRDVVGLSVY